MTNPADSSGVERPRCACHDEPLWGKRCSVNERARNARRIRVQVAGVSLFVGRAPDDESTKGMRVFLQQHRQEVKDGWLHA